MNGKVKSLIKKAIFIAKKSVYSFNSAKECPICGAGYFKFETYNNRKNAICFNCFSMERDRLHYVFLKEHTTLFDHTKKKLIHFAPEKSLYNYIKSYQNIDYYTADLMVTLNARFQARPEYVMSVTDIEFDDNSFDFLICSHVLDDVDDDARAIAEIYRVLKKKGRALISVPVDTSNLATIEFYENEKLKKELNIGAENKRIYGSDIIDLLAIPGFEVRKITASEILDNSQIDRYSVREKDIFFICEKR
jgi:SAM-dependent methyltransferase